MKKVLLLSIALIAFAAFASAAPIQCAVLMVPNTVANNGNICTITATAGQHIATLTLTATDDFTGFQSGNPVVSFASGLTQSSNVFTIPTFCNVTTSGGNSIPCNDTVLPSQTVNGLNLASYTIQLTNASNTVAGGVVTGDSIVLNLDFAQAPNAGGVPEPMTVSLMGVGLLGLGLIGRKVKK